MNLIDEALEFLETFIKKVEDTGVDVSQMNLDHVAYQASTSADYEARKPEFEAISDYQHEAIVGDRRVGVFRLKQPIEFRGNHIVAFELIEPKRGHEQVSAWEHAEYVLNEPYTEFMKRYPELDWDVTSIERYIYSHLKLKLDDSTQVKFHLMDILETIRLEEKLKNQQAKK